MTVLAPVRQLYASVMLKEPLYMSRVRSCLEKALDKDPSYLPAAYLLAEIYEKVRLRLRVTLLFGRWEQAGLSDRHLQYTKIQ